MFFSSVGFLVVDAMDCTVTLSSDLWTEAIAFLVIAFVSFVFVFVLSRQLKKQEEKNLRNFRPPDPQNRILVLWTAAITGKACSKSGHSLLTNAVHSMKASKTEAVAM